MFEIKEKKNHEIKATGTGWISVTGIFVAVIEYGWIMAC